MNISACFSPGLGGFLPTNWSIIISTPPVSGLATLTLLAFGGLALIRRKP